MKFTRHLKSKLFQVALFVGFFEFAAIHAGAVLVAYDGFNYSPGTVATGLAGGSGWTNAWAGVLGTNTAGSLTYTDVNGLSLQTNGGSLVVGNPAGSAPATTATPNRALNNNLSGGAGTTAGAGATYWISFLYKKLNFSLGTLPFLRQANFGLFQASGEIMDIGCPNTSATVSNVLSVWSSTGAHNGSAPFQPANYPITSGSTYFILVKVVTDGTVGADNAYVWFNWTNLLVEPDVSTATVVESEVNLSPVNTLRFQAGNLNSSGSNAVFQVDEVRVGTTFGDVTPYTSSSSLAPTITTQPADATVTAGSSAAFTVSVSSILPLTYQWYFNTNTSLPNETNATLTLANVQTNNAGGYSVIVANTSGSATSLVATLNVLLPVPPSISVQPQDFTSIIGATAAFNVTASGTAPLKYQWYHNTNTLLGGATSASLSFTISQTNDAGGYSVIVTNNFGSVTSSVAALSVIYTGPASLPVFPGADGAAKFITGGRGGTVYHVTVLDKNYNDTRPGTLRYGLTDGNFQPGVPRTIVFDVAGVFWLGRFGAESNYDNGWNAGQSRIAFSGNTTIAGETAPGPVIIMGGNAHCSSVNTIVRNVMFAPGYGMQGFHEPPMDPTPGDFPDSYVYDAVDIEGQKVMLDHLTSIYATDEAISCNELANNLTIENCNVSQGQNYPQADAESTSLDYTGHALAHLLQAGSNAKISILNDLYAHQKGRLPRVGSEVGTGAFNDFRNNVYYNWLGTAGTGASGQPSFDNFINNFYLVGPGGDNPIGGTNYNLTTATGGTGIFSGIDSSATRAFVSGNLKDVNNDGDPFDTSSADASFTTITALSAANDVNIGLTLSAPSAFTNVLRHVGSRWWERPYVFTLGNTNAITTNNIAAYIDERLIRETFTGSGKIIAWADDPFNNDPNEGVEWRSLLALRADPVTGVAPFNRPANWDTDGDGMPDYWEIEHGLDPNVPDNNGDYDNDGYSNLEEYLDDIAAFPAPGVIFFTGSLNSRYADIFNWQVNGQQLNISGIGTVTTFSLWQPSRYDTAVISNRTVIVDSVGQCAGILKLTNSAVLNITNGWLAVADKLEVAAGCTVAVQLSGALRVTNNLVNNGTLRLTGAASLSVGGSFTNTGLLDIMTWNGTLPAGFVNSGTVLDRSLIKVTSSQVNGANFETTIQGYAGHNYQLQYRDDLSGGTWQNTGASVPGAGSPITLVHTGGASAQQRFYRVAVD